MYILGYILANFFFLNAFTSYYCLTLQKYLDVLPGFILKSFDNSLANIQFYWETIVSKQLFLNKSCINPFNFELLISFFCKECNLELDNALHAY